MKLETTGTGRQFLGRAMAALTYPLSPADILNALRPETDAGAGRIEAIDRPTARATTLTIRPARGVAGFRSGQFVRLGVDIDGVRHWRCYSISSSPHRADGCFTVTVQAIAGGRVSNFIADELEIGDRVRLEPPAGDFVLPERLPNRLLFLTAGSGITPVMSMLLDIEARGEMPDVTLIHAAQTRDDVIFAAELEALAQRHPQLRVHFIHTRETGRLDCDRLASLCPDWSGRETWACGPDAMLQTFETHWQQAGLADRLHVERFRPRQVQPTAAAESGRVQFLRSACHAEGRSDQSVLELAELSGLAPEHGCRMGICHGCTATLRSGRVRDVRNGQTFDEEGDLVQICVCAPVGDVAIDL